MTTTVGMRELSSNLNILDGYDYVDVEDKKTHEYKVSKQKQEKVAKEKYGY